MSIFGRYAIINNRGKKAATICLALVLLITQLGIARADASKINPENTRNSSNLPNEIGSLEAPIAVDDSGAGFETYQDRVLYTANVMANDIDSDGNLLYIAGVDSSLTKGLVMPHDSAMDKSFDYDGKVSVDIGLYPKGSDVTIQPDGKIILVGYGWNSITSDDFVVLRFNTDGSLDQSFGEGGKVVTDFGWTDRAYAVTLQPDNKILVIGYVYVNNTNNIGIARYNPDGSLDQSFDGDGKLTTAGINVQDMGHMGIKLQSDNKIVAVGTCFNEIGYVILIARFNSDGSPDLSFDGDGFVTEGIRNYTLGYDVVIQPDQKILVSGFATDYTNNTMGFVVARINPDGSLDESFQGGGISLTDVGLANDSSLGRAIDIQIDQKFISVGNTNDHFAMVRYNPDGSLDTSFNGDGIVLNDTMIGQDVRIQPNGKILVAGTSGSNGNTDMCIYRYNQDGSIDSTFGVNGSVKINFGDDQGNAISIGQKGTIDIAGTAGSMVGLAQLIGDGTFTYNPNHQFDYLNAGEQAFDTFKYTLSDGVFTDTATVTITINGFNKYTYLPFILYQLNLYGRVTDKGAPAAGISLSLRFFDGTNWSTMATTVTNPDGVYNFANIPDLTPGQKYYVLYTNQNDPNRLWIWGTKVITSYTIGSSINIGNFDISNIILSSPAPGSIVTLPYTFQWVRRLASLGDSYEFDLYDPYDGDPYFYTPMLGYVDNYILTGLPAGFVNGANYAWEVYAYSPDGGSGISFYSYIVSFSNSASGQSSDIVAFNHDAEHSIEDQLRR
jgi:uncharacterized delta-60 repeat protein